MPETQLPNDADELSESLVSADVAIIADFSSAELSWKLAAETRIQSDAGLRTVYLHFPRDPQNLQPVHPDLNSCVAEGLAVPIDYSRQVVRARLAIIREPEAVVRPFLTGDAMPFPRLLADRVLCISSGRRSADAGALTPQRINGFIRNTFGSTTLWAAEVAEARDSLRQAGLHVLDELWLPSLPTTSIARGRQPINRVAPVIGCVGPALASWYNDGSRPGAALAPNGGATLRVLLTAGRGTSIPSDWEVLTTDDIGLTRFLRGLDFFLATPAKDATEATILQVATALSLGVPTILDPSLRPYFGQGPVYAEPDRIPEVIREHSDPLRFMELSEQCATAGNAFGAHVHRSRLDVLLGPSPSRPPSRNSARRKRVLFVSTNGIGLGHLTRQLAIARRLPESVSPVFATMSQAFRIVQQFGYPVEYVPSVTQCVFDLANWDGWLAEQLSTIIDQHGIDGLVFDGVKPFEGVIETLRRRRGVAATWIRRAMWRKERASENLGVQRYFNLVIEPGEVAAARDAGATSRYRSVVMPVSPIRLLEQEELLDRQTAAEKLGLDPGRPAVLIQLGTGVNHNVIAKIDTILATLAEHPDVQPVIADWLISNVPQGLWPGIPRIAAFPLARYYAAFDFTISETGYNSFHEMISFGIPSILVANPKTVFDDQDQRAAFADEHGAAITLPEADSLSVKAAIEALLEERARWFLSANCRRLAQPNGAAAAAEAIASTVNA